ncbi:hypothetical protein [Dactylosporangium matsuzakiense]|uniref:Uncharacterized protein n=1 Tax=Dactylosporangium matsuzakiense TaxID=53360 RepID=A0A9W6NT29_9ACTN|nr:hypothetical protein [Dactylosporangium matsuzakiense]GLL07752.1 hypothetical protein GCM10017581_095090 [Dactylosporangium matsuzakiense]
MDGQSLDGPGRAGRVRRLVARLALLVLAAAALYQGLWAQFAPRSFFYDFPAGLTWVAGDGPYNEHLVRDVGGLVNGLGAMAVVAALWMSAPLLVANAVAWTVYAVPHFVYHVNHPLAETSMQRWNVVVLTSEVVLPLLGLLGIGTLSRRRHARMLEGR